MTHSYMVHVHKHGSLQYFSGMHLYGTCPRPHAGLRPRRQSGPLCPAGPGPDWLLLLAAMLLVRLRRAKRAH